MPSLASEPTRVLIVGTGLIGVSIASYLSHQTTGYAVSLADASPTALRVAVDLKAGVAHDDAHGVEPDLVVIATPPDVAASLVIEALRSHPRAVVTDVASVKGAIASAVALADVDASRYVGSHPMAGREQSGPLAARPRLFAGKPWVVVPHTDSSPEAVRAVTRLAQELEAVPITMDAAAHDEAVASVSHVPQVVASLVADALRGLPEASVELAGQGLRDVTRIADSDPMLWTQIIAGNASAVAASLTRVRDRLTTLVEALDGIDDDDSAARLAVATVIHDGRLGRGLIPGKHGNAPTRYEVVRVLVPDQPGELGRLFGEVGQIGVNIEDLRIEHEVGAPVGVAELAILPSSTATLRAALEDRGWTLGD